MVNLFKNDNRHNLLNAYKTAMYSAKPFSWIISFSPIDNTEGFFSSPFFSWEK